MKKKVIDYNNFTDLDKKKNINYNYFDSVKDNKSDNKDDKINEGFKFDKNIIQPSYHNFQESPKLFPLFDKLKEKNIDKFEFLNDNNPINKDDKIDKGFRFDKNIILPNFYNFPEVPTLFSLLDEIKGENSDNASNNKKSPNISEVQKIVSNLHIEQKNSSQDRQLNSPKDNEIQKEVFEPPNKQDENNDKENQNSVNNLENKKEVQKIKNEDVEINDKNDNQKSVLNYENKEEGQKSSEKQDKNSDKSKNQDILKIESKKEEHKLINKQVKNNYKIEKHNSLNSSQKKEEEHKSSNAQDINKDKNQIQNPLKISEKKEEENKSNDLDNNKDKNNMGNINNNINNNISKDNNANNNITNDNSNNTNGNNNVNNSNSKNKDEKIVNFNFDKFVIKPYDIDNIKYQENSKIFKIFQEYQDKNLEKVSFNLNSLIIQKVTNSQYKKDSSFEILLNSLKENVLLPIRINKQLKKINLIKKNFGEIENINNIIKSNKNIDFFENKEDGIILEKPKIISDENKEENIYNFNSMLNQQKDKYEKIFNCDTNKLKKLDININTKDDLHSNFFSQNNPIFMSYTKKNIKAFYLANSNEKLQKLKFELKNENDEINSISEINERRINKYKFTRILNKPNLEENKININCDILHSSFFEEIEKNYDESNIKSFSNENDSIINKLHIDDEFDNFVTEIFYSFKQDIITSPKLELDINRFDDKIEDIHIDYIDKYIINFDLYNDYFDKIDIEDFDDKMNLNIIHKKYKNFRKKRIKNKEKYLLEGKGSLELIKDNLSQDKFNKSETADLHYLSLKLKKINDSNDIDEIQNLANISDDLDTSNNNKNLKLAKKLKYEINRSLMNKNMSRNKNEIINKDSIKKSYDIKNINNISLDSVGNMNKKRDYDIYLMKRIKKTNDDINKKQKKIYNNKLKVQQENKINSQIKREKKYIFILLLLFVSIPIFNKFYHKYMDE